ncbi:DUF423 domain-containing protein [Thiolinea disciformis]|uniref:DUF423 domain-containing protein n=1 Tax=Thiolinea disciformis TaxID=125614 RepID=UPI0003668DED|nr:DUF423 domain-containing protein [Thiolinea disciformis]
MQKRHFLLIGAVMGMLAVILGAFGAHGLEKMMDAKMLARFHTGVEYQFYHALALILTASLAPLSFNHRWQLACWSFLLGVVLFSGSLYVYTLTGVIGIAMITPIGGLAFISGWLWLALALWYESKSS